MATSSSKRSWFTARAAARGVAEIAIYDDIGAFGVSAEGFRVSLGDAKGLVRVRINSKGGDLFASLAMYHMLKGHPGRVEVLVDGLAASAASIVAMAGDVIRMPENTFMMIHDPSTTVMGDADDMADAADSLTKLRNSMAVIYSERTGLPQARVLEMMAETTWLTAAEAVEQGFADEVIEAADIAAKFDLSKYPNPPQALAKGSERGSAATMKEGQMADEDQRDQETEEEAEARKAKAAKAKAKKVKAAEDDEDEGDDKGNPFAKKETRAQMETRIRAEIQEQAQEITAICSLAGMPGKASEFIAKGTPTAEVLAALSEMRMAGGHREGGRDVNTHMPAGNMADVSAEMGDRLDPTKVFARWNKRQTA